jgi:hypothetical protein
MLVLARPAFCSENAAAVSIFEISVRKLIMSFGVLSIFVVDSQIPLPILKEPMPLYELIFPPCGRLVFAPRIPLVVDELVLVNEVLGVLVCTVV